MFFWQLLNVLFFDILLMCLSVVFIVFILLGFHWASYNCWFKDFFQVWKISSYSFFKYFSAFPPLYSSTTIPITCILNHMILWHRSLRLFFFFFGLVYLCTPVWNVPLACLWVHWSSSVFSILLNPNSKFFISCIMYFSSRSSVWSYM